MNFIDLYGTSQIKIIISRTGRLKIMMTVKELSKLTGISVRTLHYYDEIGLFLPTEKSEAGYRLYDDKALEILQQILFFREFDIQLKDIKAVMENPELEKKENLENERKKEDKKKKRNGKEKKKRQEKQKRKKKKK